MSAEDAYRLIFAAFASCEEMLELLSNEPHLIGERTGLGETPLHYLAVENQLEAVQLLLKHGAEINTVNKCGGTPLSEAALLGHDKLVACLLEHKAMLTLPDQTEPTLHNAVLGGSASVVIQVLAAGAKVDEPNDLGETALHVAAETDDRFDILNLLLEAGVNVALQRIFGETPLDVAISNSSNNCAAALIAYGAFREGNNLP